jgi:hypothetical protein
VPCDPPRQRCRRDDGAADQGRRNPAPAGIHAESSDIERAALAHRAQDDFREMESAPVRRLTDLFPAAEAVHDNERVRRGAPHRGQQLVLSQLYRNHPLSRTLIQIGYMYSLGTLVLAPPAMTHRLQAIAQRIAHPIDEPQASLHQGQGAIAGRIETALSYRRRDSIQLTAAV